MIKLKSKIIHINKEQERTNNRALWNTEMSTFCWN